MDRTRPLNEEQAEAAIAAIDNPVTRNLVKLAVAQARMSFMRSPGQSDQDWEAGLPAQAFDMVFYVRAVAQTFSQDSTIRQILDGADLQEATGWDV